MISNDILNLNQIDLKITFVANNRLKQGGSEQLTSIEF